MRRYGEERFRIARPALTGAEFSANDARSLPSYALRRAVRQDAALRPATQCCGSIPRTGGDLNRKLSGATDFATPLGNSQCPVAIGQLSTPAGVFEPYGWGPANVFDD